MNTKWINLKKNQKMPYLATCILLSSLPLIRKCVFYPCKVQKNSEMVYKAALTQPCTNVQNLRLSDRVKEEICSKIKGYSNQPAHIRIYFKRSWETQEYYTANAIKACMSCIIE